jgi:hypothetical protein
LHALRDGQPAASSAALLMRKPLDRRCTLLAIASVWRCMFSAARNASILVLILTPRVTVAQRLT